MGAAVVGTPVVIGSARLPELPMQATLYSLIWQLLLRHTCQPSGRCRSYLH